jgi:hypothetical protein
MAEQEEATVRVELDVYSGRPNPSWKLSQREIEELRTLLDASTEHPPDEGAQLPYLGYAGFIITSRGEADLPDQIEVRSGVLIVTRERGITREGSQSRGRKSSDGEEPRDTRRYADTHRIEAWLLEQAEERGHAQTIAAMGGPRPTRGEREPS